MASSWELQLISAILTSDEPVKRYDACVLSGIHYNMFDTMEGKQLWRFLEAYHVRPERPGYLPSVQTVKEKYAAIDLPTPMECLEDLCDNVRNGFLRREAEKSLEGFKTGLRTNPLAAMADYVSVLTTLQDKNMPAVDKKFSEAGPELRVEVEVRRDKKDKLPGMPWPWPIMNEQLGGMAPGDYYLAWALPKSGKTFWGLIIVAHLYKEKKRVLVYSKEMTWEVLRDRLACIITKTNYTDWKKGRLTVEQSEAILAELAALSAASDAGEIIFTQADRLDGSPGGPAEIAKKMAIYRPDFVFLDSSYMLELPNTDGSQLDWKNLLLISRTLKALCKRTKIPLLAIMQENETQALKGKGTRGTSSMAFGKMASADCDGGFNLVYHKFRRELSVKYSILREAEGDGFTMHMQPCHNFDYVHDTLHDVGDDYAERAKQKSGEQAVSTAIAVNAKKALASTPTDLLDDLQGLRSSLAPGAGGTTRGMRTLNRTPGIPRPSTIAPTAVSEATTYTEDADDLAFAMDDPDHMEEMQ